MPTEKLTFTGHAGDRLAARLDLPDGPHLTTALFAHCFTCSKDIIAARRISARLASMGFAVLRFDFTGLGHSGGEFANTSFSSNIADLKSAAEALTARDMAPSLLIGHSLGGAAAIKVASDIPSVRAVATIGAPFDPAHVTQKFAAAIPDIARDGKAAVTLGGRTIVIGDTFLQDISKSSLTDALKHLKAALLVMHAPRDDTVGIENATQIFTAARHPKSFVTLGDADHLLTKPDDAEYAADMIATWARRYITLAQPEHSADLPEGVLRVSEADPAGFLQDIQSGPDHHALADEPRSFGGTDKGMSPYGFLGAGLGACTSMTIRMYARRKNWPLDGISVDVSHAQQHGTDASTTGNKISTFTRTIHLRGDLTDDQRQRLLEIANKCPVHRTLETGAAITTMLA